MERQLVLTKCKGEKSVEFLPKRFNKIFDSGEIAEAWRRSVLVSFFKNKGDMQTCSNYRGIR